MIDTPLMFSMAQQSSFSIFSVCTARLLAGPQNTHTYSWHVLGLRTSSFEGGNDEKSEAVLSECIVIDQEDFLALQHHIRPISPKLQPVMQWFKLMLTLNRPHHSSLTLDFLLC